MFYSIGRTMVLRLSDYWLILTIRWRWTQNLRTSRICDPLRAVPLTRVQLMIPPSERGLLRRWIPLGRVKLSARHLEWSVVFIYFKCQVITILRPGYAALHGDRSPSQSNSCPQASTRPRIYPLYYPLYLHICARSWPVTPQVRCPPSHTDLVQQWWNQRNWTPEISSHRVLRRRHHSQFCTILERLRSFCWRFNQGLFSS